MVGVAACGGITQNEYDDLMAWFGCQECTNNERQAVEAIGDNVVPFLADALAGRAMANRRARAADRFGMTWSRISNPAMDSAVYVSSNLANYDVNGSIDGGVTPNEGYGCQSVQAGPGTWEVGDATGNENSPYGLVDMAGNVSEWVVDCYDETYYAQCSGGCTNPVNTATGCGYRVLRGGSFGTGIGDVADQIRAMRVVARGFRDHDHANAGASYWNVGFRCVRSAP